MSRKEYLAEYYKKNKEKLKAKGRKFYEDNKEKRRDQQKKYDKTLAGKYTRYKDSANQRDLHFDISLEYFATYWQQPCHYCGDPIETIGIDRINSNLGYVEGNLRSCCRFCNIAKNDNTEAFFKDKLFKIVAKYMEREE